MNNIYEEKFKKNNKKTTHENNAPLFSILIPLTRAHLISFSLGSIMDLDDDDFEIIISHNAAPDEPDLKNLPEDPRIRYVRTPEMLAITDSWEFALSHARGEWVTLVGDDDGLLPNMISTMRRVISANPHIDVYCWRSCQFIYPDWQNSQEAGRAALPRFSGRLLEIRSADYLREVFAPREETWWRIKMLLPTIMRGAYRRDLVERIRMETGRLFHLVTPDYAAMTALLASTDRFVFVDAPFTVLGSTPDSLAAAAVGDPEKKMLAYQQIGNPDFHFAKLRDRYSNRPVIFETVMRMRERFIDNMNKMGVEPDWLSFLHWQWKGLMEIQKTGGDTIKSQQEIADYLEKMTPAELACWERREQECAAKRQEASSPLQALFDHFVTGVGARAVKMLLPYLPIGIGVVNAVMRRQGISFMAAPLGINNIHDFCRFSGRILDCAPVIDNLTPERGESYLRAGKL